MPTTIGVNAISDVWFRTFLDTVDPAQTAIELAFLERQLPLRDFARVLDLCCGRGRHALPLSDRGYAVTGVDREAALIAQARAAGTTATFLQMDVREIRDLRQTWDAALIMWASFGYFTAKENRAQLETIRKCLRPGGRLILDVYNYEFFVDRQGERQITRNGVLVTQRFHIRDDRLEVELRYAGHDVIDRFSWQIFRPEELCTFVSEAGFEPIALCAEFDEQKPPHSEVPRMQLVMALGHG